MTQPEPPIAKFSKYPNMRGPVRLFSDEEVWEIRREFREGKNLTTLARERECSKVTMAAVLYGTDAYENV